MHMISLQIRVSGRVQGVGYRQSLRHVAQRGGVRGWVRNRANGTVEALLQGSAESVNTVVEWARHGPPAARVTEIVTSPPDAQFDRPYESFEYWPTL
jgi:acylphosphatase